MNPDTERAAEREAQSAHEARKALALRVLAVPTIVVGGLLRTFAMPFDAITDWLLRRASQIESPDAWASSEDY